MTPRCFILLACLLVFRLAHADQLVEEQIQKMSLHEKVGQVFLVGFPQHKLDKSLKKFIEEQRPGGFILFRRNIKSLSHIQQFTSDLKKVSNVHGAIPFLAVDQEGGSVTRVPYFPSLPSALAIGLTQKPQLSYALGAESGELLRLHGFNFNFAPVLDLADSKYDSFIGTRSFSPDPLLTGEMGFQYAKGLQEAGIIPTGKHFPGLGGTKVDLHIQAGGFKSSLEQFKNRDLKPFQQFSNLGPFSALMVSQMSYPFLDPSGLPAPFSKAILTDLLRTEIGFQGLVITDDLQMKGSTIAFPARDAALESLKAGADIVMISWSARDQKEAMTRVEEAVTNDEWPLSELEAKVRRILVQKNKIHELSLTLTPPSLVKNSYNLPSTKKLEKLDLEILNAKLASQDAPIRKEASVSSKEKVCVLTSEGHFLRGFKKSYEGPLRPLLMTNRSHSKKFIQSLNACPLIVFTVSGKKSAKVLDLLAPLVRLKTIVVNFGPESLIPIEFEWAKRIDLAHHHFLTGSRVADVVKDYLVERAKKSHVHFRAWQKKNRSLSSN